MVAMSASECHAAFNSILKTSEREDFKLLLCNLDTCEEQHKALLKPLLLEENGHQRAENWGKYIAYVVTSLSERNAHLQRLVNKALEFLPEAENRDNKFYLGVHLRSAGLKAGQENALKYIETIIVKKRIGLKCSVLYLEWAKTILRLEVALDVETIRKARDALKRGIKANATPQELLEEGLKFLDGYNDTSKHEEMAQNLRDITAIRADGTMVASSTEARELLRQHPALSSSSSSSSSRQAETSFTGTVTAATPATTTKRGAAYDGADDDTHDIQRNVSTSGKKRRPGTVEKTLGGPTCRINRLGGLGGLGKVGRCQRVVKKEDEDDDVDSSRDMSFEQSRVEEDTATTTTTNNGPTETMGAKSITATATVDVSIMNSSKESGMSGRSSLSEASAGSKRKSTSSSEGEESTGSNKLDLSKYIDDKLLSFDPQVARSAMKRSKTSRTDALNSSTLSTTGTVAIASAVKVPQSASKRASFETKKHADKSAEMAVDKENVAPRHNNGHGNGNAKEAAPAKASKPQQEVRFAAAATSSFSSSSSSSSSRVKGAEVTTTSSSNDNPLAHFSETFKVIHMNGQQYLRFGTLGKGGSSCVYSILSQDSQVYAFKKVFVSANTADPESLFDSYMNEIELLNSLKGSPYIIQLIDSSVDKESLTVSMIMEAGEIDLSKVLKKRNQIHGISPFFIRMIWTEMLESVDYIHENRIVHGDLKPANFVFVKGHLKLIDFGIAKAFNNDTTNIYRDSQIGTINYMAPEAIVAPKQEEMNNSSKGAKLRLGRASDVWSLGCILYQLVYGSPPFAALNTIQKLHAIPNPNYDISYPTKIRVGPTPKEGEEGNPDDIWYIHSHTIDSMKACFYRDPAKRSPIRGEGGLLSHPFLAVGDSDKNVL